MQKARRHNNNVAPTACKRMVSGSFHPPIRGTFHLSFTVLVHYRSLVSIQPYQMVLADSKGVSPAPPYSGITHVHRLYLYRALTFYGRPSQIFQVRWYSNRVSYNPDIAVTISVWANPSSLATTLGITFVFFSSGYLDVSVLRVCSTYSGDGSSNRRVAPFGCLRITVSVQLPVDFRSLARPSSPSRAQAFPIHP